jgi:hypothetical protein
VIFYFEAKKVEEILKIKNVPVYQIFELISRQPAIHLLIFYFDLMISVNAMLDSGQPPLRNELIPI